MQNIKRLNIYNLLLKKVYKDERNIRNDLEGLIKRIQWTFESVHNMKILLAKNTSGF